MDQLKINSNQPSFLQIVGRFYYCLTENLSQPRHV